MSQKIKPPTQKSNGFIITLIAIVIIAVAVIAYIVYNGQNAGKEAIQKSMEKTSMVVTTGDDVITLSGKNKKPDAKQVDLYEDYSCPHCAELAEATDGDMKTRIEDGALVVNIHSLDFLDSAQIKHSSAAGAAALAIAKSGDAHVYWNYRKMLFGKQKSIYAAWKTPKDFADAAKDMGADSKTVKAIENQSMMDTYKKEADANSAKLKKILGKVSSPQVVVDGKAIVLANKKGDGFANWPDEVVKNTVRFQHVAQGTAPKPAGDKK